MVAKSADETRPRLSCFGLVRTNLNSTSRPCSSDRILWCLSTMFVFWQSLFRQIWALTSTYRRSAPRASTDCVNSSLRRIRKWSHSSLDNESAANLMHTFVTSRVDYCNAVYAISPKMITNRQQNGDERDRWSVTLVNDRELKAILRDELHWLNVPKRIQAWCDGVAYRCLHARRLGTSLITSSQPLMLLLAVFVYDPLTWIVSLFLVADLACTAAGPFITMARQSGTRCQI